MDDLMTPDKIAEKGDEIYNRKFRKKYEGDNNGKFVAVDVINEKAYLGDYPEDALENAEKNNADTNLYLIKIGADTDFHVGYTGDQYYGMDLWTGRFDNLHSPRLEFTLVSQRDEREHGFDGFIQIPIGLLLYWT